LEIGCKENKRAQSALLFSIVSNVKEDITVAICFRTNQNPRSEWRREAPPRASWVYNPNKIGDRCSIQIQQFSL
jgi:hypothetical protein